VIHPKAKCRWCGGPFEKIYGWQWICTNPPCAERQIAQAVMAAAPEEGQSPYLFLPLPLQVDIEDSPFKRLLIWGPAGISKSYGGRWHLYKRCRKIEGYQALLLRCTYDQLYKNHLKYMAWEARQLGDAKFLDGTNKPKQMQFENASTLFMGFCQHEADIGQHLGPEWDEILFEQAEQFLPKALNEISTRDRGSPEARRAMSALGLDTGRTRLLANTGGQAMDYLRDFYVDKNPDPEVYENYNGENYAAMTGDIADNPYLAPNYLNETLGGLEKARYAQLARGSWDAFPGQFFSDFDPSRHVG
jgi:hypothetical protein